ncbi:pyruvate, water dikinase regulatory protein [Companilactobacillus sp.]|jgi:regulator of PEP synthase PpsR (kinase-PPPase family)|uniref:pyruvate, water dikinase regulatory protein n=1 Tax=Companilactobacillus sp. TaxID=2767905 RepID=UPI0025C4E5B2|nr:pyruvate, water dikinase regulatory protein [Companilactobacillus sp.]MCH4008214.1 kinase/pyrophosphorylase [Companilactobacillus sp.]MCH4051607.1 kinase/pyrophosphorylase [Companilactobacillus sp.]MCH4076157.1 kinase/pyrophosphorylase [Companilactobacillus sp.]MCH4124732.1 kinase/pyrophosphorylase [Companilactobacillus sp.]MCH4131274.1 kinase/pyrophosphorylase [Companilactobacillus sp.]
MTEKQDVFVLSDAAGETAQRVARAAFTQFPMLDIVYANYPFVKNDSQLENILKLAKEKNAVIIHTLVTKETIHTVEDYCQNNNVIYYDILNPIIGTFAQVKGVEPIRKKGLTHNLDSDYFDMISAMEFTLTNDDGKNPKGFLDADLVLLGISRTSKTPLSLYLANKNIKVANLPLVPTSQIPEELWQVDPKKIVGLTNDMNVLLKIRRQRMIAYGLDPNTTYSAEDEIKKELDYSNKIYEKLGCPVINTADRSIEETAALIMEQLNFNGYQKS